MLKKFILLFPCWAILLAILGYSKPEWVVPHKDWIAPLLMFIMFCMGISLTPRDFLRALKQPKVIVITLLLQFLWMPLLAFLLAKGLHLNEDLLIGMVLVGAVSGGTASNVMVYLARGDVALSITMTAVSTLISVFLTPLLTQIYLSQTIDVQVSKMLIDILKMVFLPVVLGLVVHLLLQKIVDRLHDMLALFSMLAIVVIIAIVVGLNHERVVSAGALLMLAIVLHNGLGLLGGYSVAKLLGYEHKIAKTVAIEVGMQNSGLATVLAIKYFTPFAALPGAIFSIWHNISGAILAAIWAHQEDTVGNRKV